jgi:hypothetical protein
MHSMYNAAEYPQGVPNPDVPDVSLYPTYEHGPDYTRAVFGEPFVRQPFNVMNGLGQSYAWRTTQDQATLAAQRYPQWATSGIGAIEIRRKPFYKAEAYWYGVGAAVGLGMLLALAAAPKGPRRNRAIIQAGVAFGIVGIVASSVTYATTPDPLEEAFGG